MALLLPSFSGVSWQNSRHIVSEDPLNLCRGFLTTLGDLVPERWTVAEERATDLFLLLLSKRMSQLKIVTTISLFSSPTPSSGVISVIPCTSLSSPLHGLQNIFRFLKFLLEIVKLSVM